MHNKRFKNSDNVKHDIVRTVIDTCRFDKEAHKTDEEKEGRRCHMDDCSKYSSV